MSDGITQKKKADLFQQLVRRDGAECQACGLKSVVGDWPYQEDLTLDHLIPRSKGGTWVLDNLQLLCKSCNSQKGTDSTGKTVRHANPMMQQGFTVIPNAVLLRRDLSVTARVLYAMLLHYARQSDECWPGQERLADDLGLSERGIRNALRELATQDLVVPRRRGKGQTNLYVLPLPGPAGDIGSLAAKNDWSRPANGAGLDRQDLPEKKKDAEEAVRGGIKTTTSDEEVLWQHFVRACEPLDNRLSSSRRGVLRHALKEAPLELCLQAVDGLIVWQKQRGGNLDLRRIFVGRPNGGPLTDQIEFFATQAENSNARPDLTSEGRLKMERLKDELRKRPGNEQARVELWEKYGVSVQVAEEYPGRHVVTFEQSR